MGVELGEIFNSAVNNTLFNNKSVLQIRYTPDSIPHRDKQIKSLALILASTLRGERPSNLFIYGKTGTGKTVSVQYVRDELIKKGEELGVEIKFNYLNCKLKKVADTEYRILAALIKQLGGSVPATGLPTDQIWAKFIELIDDKKQLIVFIFDEIDQAIKKVSDTFLYSLTRLNQELNLAQISFVGISNDVTFLENIDPRVRSSLGEEEFVFPPYNAIQLQDILNKRSVNAFRVNVLQPGVVAKCAAFAAREHGDVRRAIDLLRVAGELAERDNSKEISLKHMHPPPPVLPLRDRCLLHENPAHKHYATRNAKRGFPAIPNRTKAGGGSLLQRSPSVGLLPASARPWND